MTARATLLPFYAVCDISASMREDGRIDALNDAVAATCDAAAMHPVIADRIRFGLVSFSGEAEVALPLCDVGMLDGIPTLVPRGLTNYGTAFGLMRTTIESDVAQLVADGYRVFRPTMFFLTDGRPTDAMIEWRAAHSRMVDPDFPHRPNVVAFGLGDAPTEILAEISTVAAYTAADSMSAPAAIAAFGTMLVESVVASSTTGTFTLPDAAPAGLIELDDQDLL
jgi:uncharacterized protein YegL